MFVKMFDDNKDCLNKIIKIKEIKLKNNNGKFNRFGDSLDNNIVLISSENEYFYGWEKSWNKLKLNINNINEGDKLEIKYIKKNGFNNWKSVKKLENNEYFKNENIENNDDENDDDILKVVNEIMS